MEARSRPIGISILSVLYIMGGWIGGILLAIFIYKMARYANAGDVLASAGFPSALLFAGVTFLLFMSVATGFAMWRGARWGWYLGSFYSMLSVVQNAIALFTMPMIVNALSAEASATMTRPPEIYFIRYGGKVVINALIFMYFFKDNVREYFFFEQQAKWKPIVVELLIGLCMTTAFSVAVRRLILTSHN